MDKTSIFEDKFQKLIGNGLSFLQLDSSTNFIEESTEKDDQLTINKNLTCSYCKVEFFDPTLHRQHYKLDWHRYNLKQNILNRSILNEEQFNERTDDISSISGSDSEEEDNVDTLAIAQGKIFLKNFEGKVFSCFRCLLAGKKDDLDSTNLQSLQSINADTQWALLMLGGGHFAGAVFQGATGDKPPLLHKTFHCYTVRAGQGGSQSARDGKNAGSQPKSAGASLRRYNETALVQHVKDIVEKWTEPLAKCNLIIYRASGPYNRNVLFGGKTPLLDKNDPRLRTIPFSTRRATFKELKRVHEILSTVLIYDSLENALSTFSKTKSPENDSKRTKSNNINRSKSRERVPRPLSLCESSSDSEEENGNDVSSNLKQKSAPGADLVAEEVTLSFSEELQGYGDSLTPEERNYKKQQLKKVKKPSGKNKSKARKAREREEARKAGLVQVIANGTLDEVILALKCCEIKETSENSELSAQRTSYSEILDEKGNTPLHIAAQHDRLDVIKFLLSVDSDLCAKNVKQHTPYVCTPNKTIREIFKDFAREHPDKYNYNKAQIPVNTNVQSAEEIAEKKRAQKKVKRDKDKEKRREQEVIKVERVEKNRFLQLSDREKRALAAERRIINQQGNVISRCFLCAADITGKVPFEYLANRFCSVECLKAHRMQSPVVLS